MVRKKKPAEKTLPTKIVPNNPTIDRLAEELVEKKVCYANERASQYESGWATGLKYLECRSPDPNFDWMSKAFLPLIYRDFRTIYPRLRKILFGSIPLMKTIGTPNENLEKYISTCTRKNKGYLALSDILWDATIYSTGVGKVFWDSDYSIVEKRVPKITPGKQVLERAMAEAQGREDDTLEYETIEEPIILVDRPLICHVPLWNFFCNGNESSDINDVDCFEEMLVDINYLKMRSKDPKLNPTGYKWGIYDNVGQIADLEDISTALNDPQQKIRNVREESQLGETRKFNIRLITGQCDFEYKGNFYRNGLVSIAQVENDTRTINLTLRARPCLRSDGRKNYFKINYERIPGRFYGRSLPEAQISLQELINDFFRAQMNRDTLALHKQIFFDVNRVDDPSLLLCRMGGLSPVNGSPRDLIQEMNIDPTHPGSWQVTETLSNWALEASGAYRNLAGDTDASNRTASGIQSLLGQSQERILDTAREMAESLADCGDALVCTIRDNVANGDAPKKIEFSYVNNKGKEEKVTLTDKDIPKDVEIYIPTIFERGDRQQQANQIIQLMPTLMQNLDEDNANALKKRVWKQMELEGEDELFNQSQQSVPIELVQAVMQKMGIDPAQFGAVLNQMSQEQMQGGPGGNGGKPQQTGQPKKDQGQGSANVPMAPMVGANTGRMK